jgi:hypothetical protein
VEKMYVSPPTLNFACPHMTIGNVEAARCFVCGPLIGIPTEPANYTVTTTDNNGLTYIDLHGNGGVR